MNDTVNSAIKISITMTIVMFVLSIVFLVLGMSQELFRSQTRGINNEVVDAYDYEMSAITNYPKDIPATVVYSTLLKNEDVIESVSGSATNRDGNIINVTSANSLANLFDSKVTIKTTKNIDGKYIVVISEGLS